MKTISPQLAALLANESINLCRLWTVELANGAVYRFTDTNSSILYDGNVYASAPGITISAIQTVLNGEPGDATITFSARNDVIAKNAIRRGALDSARVSIVAVDFANLSFGDVPLFSGVVAELAVTDANYSTFELRGALYAAERTFLERYSERCRNTFGDSNCGIDVEALGVAFTVEETGPRFSYVGSAELTQDADTFNMGFIRFTSGENLNLEYEIGKFARSPDESTGRAALLVRPRFPIALGDEALIFPGCNKQIKTDCFRRYNNVENFRGEPFVPNLTFEAAIDNLPRDGPDFELVDTERLQYLGNGAASGGGLAFRA